MLVDAEVNRVRGFASIMSTVLHQVEFLIEGYLLPIAMGKLRVSENLILEHVYSEDKPFVTLGYVGVATVGDGNPFPKASDYMDFFLLIYTLMSGQRVSSIMGVGTHLDNMKSLGRKRVSFHVEKVQFEGKKPKHDPLTKQILEVKKRFLRLLPDRQEIMDGYLGIALSYYYFAVNARRLEEAVINLMIAAEALVCIETAGVRKNLSRRLSAMIEEDESERAKISRKMLELYKLRSGIIHGGGKKPSFDDTRVLFGYIMRAIDRGLSLRHLSKAELVARLDVHQGFED